MCDAGVWCECMCDAGVCVMLVYGVSGVCKDVDKGGLGGLKPPQFFCMH